MSLKPIVVDLWAATSVAGVLVAATLLVRDRVRAFPIFSTYALYSVLENVLSIWIYRTYSHSIYMDWYVYLGLVDEGLQLAVFYEVARDVFCPTGVWARDVRRIFVAMASVSVAVALLLTFMAQPPTSLFRDTLMLRSDFFSAALMSELFVGMVVLSITAGLPWKTHIARIAQGWGTFSLVCLAFDLVRSCIGLTPRHMALYAFLLNSRKVVWIGCQVFWAVMLWREAPAPRELPQEMQMQIFALNRRMENDLGRIRSWKT